MGMIKLACETYTWQMPGEQYKGRLEHIMDICRRAGFKGIEPESSFLQHLEDPILMKEALERYNMDFAVLAIVEDWLNPVETEEEKLRTDKWIDFLKHFPSTLLATVQMPQNDRSNLKTRQNNMIECVNSISRRAAEKGIICTNHPNSPEGSVFRTEEDYEVLIEGLDLDATGYCPDVGHIAKGGMDPLDTIKKYRSTVNCVHYKDIYSDGRWAQTGKGEIDFIGITSYLKDSGFEGWIVMEDECDECIRNPDEVTLEDGIYIDKYIRPLLD